MVRIIPPETKFFHGGPAETEVYVELPVGGADPRYTAQCQIVSIGSSIASEARIQVAALEIQDVSLEVRGNGIDQGLKSPTLGAPPVASAACG